YEFKAGFSPIDVIEEFIGQQPECVHYVLSGLKDRGVVYKETVEIIEDEKLKKEYGKKLSVIGAIK
ncbi:unnamed protein product, partial [marine sediment metagenome]